MFSLLFFGSSLYLYLCFLFCFSFIYSSWVSFQLVLFFLLCNNKYYHCCGYYPSILAIICSCFGSGPLALWLHARSLHTIWRMAAWRSAGQVEHGDLVSMLLALYCRWRRLARVCLSWADSLPLRSGCQTAYQRTTCACSVPGQAPMIRAGAGRGLHQGSSRDGPSASCPAAAAFGAGAGS